MKSAPPALPVTLAECFRKRRVFVTGHTGFKGAWLSQWLLMLGAEVTGYSLPAPTDPSLFEQLELRQRMRHIDGDVRDRKAVADAMQNVDPDFIFHLAAQPLVRRSYREPAETYETNVLGTVNILEAIRLCSANKRPPSRPDERPLAAVMVTTDKVYENREWVYGYREVDRLGGYDPYSSSKACAEIAVSAWRRSFFDASGAGSERQVAIATALAGNVIGGGDWALDRIVPDAIRSLAGNEAVPVRSPDSTRPWQHVLEPLSGYLLLAASLVAQAGPVAQEEVPAYNFGPPLESNRPVRDLVEEILRHWDGAWQDRSDPAAVHEASLLNLVWDKAFHHMGWQPRWGFSETVRQTVEWYRDAQRCSSARDFQRLCSSQIERYAAASR